MANQLYTKRGSTKANVYPKNYTDNIIDRDSRKTLTEILQSFNCYFLSYTGDVESTRLQVPKSIRKQGLLITYIDSSSNISIEYYTSDSIEDFEFKSNNNWKSWSIDVKPGSITEKELSKDLVDKINNKGLSEIPNNSITSSKIVDGAVAMSKLSTEVQGMLNATGRVEIVDRLTSEDTTKALSANMGKVLNERYTELATDVDEHDKKLDILYKVALAFSGGGNKKKGTSVNVTLSWTVKVNGTAVNPSSQKLNGETLANDIRSKTFTGVTTDTTYTLVVDGVTATQSVKFYNPAYFGVVEPSYTVGNSTAGLTELTNYGKRDYEKAITTSGSKKAVYMYPSALGNLTNIKDGNNFDVFNSFTKVSGLTINGESYVAYILTKEANLNNVTFKFA